MIVERPALERRVAASVEGARIPVLLGGCGSGRTSLLLRLRRLLGADRAQYIDFAATATTPERCLAGIVSTCPFRPASGQISSFADSPRAAFEALLTFLDETVTTDGGPVTFLIDDVLDIRTFESFPGLRHVQRDLIARLASSPNRFVLASRFTNRTHRLLRDAPARFEVVHVPPIDAAETAMLAMLFDNSRREWAKSSSAAVTALAGGRAAYVHLLLGALLEKSPAPDPIAALAGLFGPDGRLTAFCRGCYEFRLHRARGYGALKAILGVLADVEPLTLTEISQRLQRTPGSTKDYLSWLEDVDLVSAQRKRYSFDDPLLRVYVRLYGRGIPPTEEDLVREIQAYAQARVPLAADPSSEPVMAAADRDSDVGLDIVEID